MTAFPPPAAAGTSRSHHATRAGLAVLAASVVTLYIAVGAALIAPDLPGRAATGYVSTGLSSPVPALRYDMPRAEDGGRARGVRPSVMARLFFGMPQPARPPEGRHLDAVTVAEARALWAEHDFRLARVGGGAAGVPRLFLGELPAGLSGVDDIALRKSVFLRTVLPLVLRVNEEVAADRARLRAIFAHRDAGGALGEADAAWLADLAAKYGASPSDRATLLKRVDVVPPSLALAQAAEESGWGTSRFAREGNALFGQWTNDPSVRGIVPRDRPADATHRVRAFPTLLDAVRAYVRNLNTHRAYADFRAARARQRAADGGLDGPALAETLLAYSERGRAYVETLRLIMRANDLAALDGAWLGTQVARAG